ncbi:DNA mismatch repair protein Msh6-like [Physella acuta]|uniref:DNA mismatch repair protein Msh6-like n=1 Tax=Physella acuta TaxID=109671 RepID=UPI0027DAD36E|nr:DNA mismatch repair protein Msh6-like [Physella acuta]
MSKTPKGKQGNTLFAYFQKTPKSENKSSEILSPRRSPNSDKKKNVSGSNSAASSPITGRTKNDVQVSSLGDIVWAKLEGFPWWPSLVCNHPTQKTHSKGGKVPMVHVQFFDDPPSRAWIKARNIKPFKGANDEAWQKGGQFYSLNNKIRKGVEDADKALGLEVDERMKLVVELQPSSEEEDDDHDEVAEKMDLDPSIFDDEMSDQEVATKENCEVKTKETEEGVTSSKPSPKPTENLTKSKRKAAQEAAVKNKRRKIIASESADEDSEEDFKPVSSEDDDDGDSSSGVDEAHIESEVEVESESESPIKESRKRKSNGTPATKSKAKKSLNLSSFAGDKKTSPTVSENTKSKLSLFTAPETGSDDTAVKDTSSFTHLHLDFLQPEKIRDANKRLKEDPDYNPRTLYVPDSFLSKQTPAMRQWWELKINHFDTVLFFKVGKFYELYHMDAVTGVNELGLIYMKGDWAHSGFPEIAYNRYADALILKGYKVARVEQTETPDMMADRCKTMGKQATKFDKVVKREICQVSTQGTKTYNYLDGDSGDATSKYLLAVCEKVESGEGRSTYGVCFIDTLIGIFHVGQFEDDRHMSRLRTLIAHYTPTQVLYERGKISSATLQLFKANLTSALKEALTPGSEFWDSGKTLKVLSEEEYFKSKDDDLQMPDVIKAMLSENDALGLTAADSSELAVRALGAVTWYLQYCLLDQELLSMKKFEKYIPIESSNLSTKKDDTFDLKQRHMVLDGVTMANLDVVWNTSTQSTQGTLLERLNTCSTSFGKRLFHQWLCSPLCQPASISDRLDAVDDLIQIPGTVEECVTILKRLPDLERLLSRIHSIGSAGKSKSHPDSRAILYEEVTYSKKKIDDFLTTIEGFKSAVKIMEKFKPAASSFKSKLLGKTVNIKSAATGDDAHFPDIAEDLEFFDTAFDHKKAKKDGVIVPSKGVDEDYDKALEDIRTIEAEFAEYLDTQKKVLGCRSITYWGTAKNRYQIEVPESAWSNIPNSYEAMSSKKGAKRFRTAAINDLLRQLMEAEDKKDACLKDIMRRIFHSFDERHSKWMAVVECLSVLDVLIALAAYSRGADGVVCRPEIVLPESGMQPLLEIRDGRHPCVARTFEGGDFIPNDTVIGVKDENDDEDGSYSESQVVLVTGPNMGGKSTLMRQVGLITIMAQIGCYVPAEKCRLTPVDRIFTRLGASDRIMAGESTFFVELSETSSILQHASKHSLVLMDELGRGTATYDGTAIACAVVKTLSENIKCRSLFSTHYHSLVEEFKNDSNVRLGHMACMVENENDEDPSQETITFLYKFVKGACPKSYGFNAARLASIPEEVITTAVQKSKQFEKTVECQKLFRSIMNSNSATEVLPLVSTLC